jgi:hypothetical protein
MNDEKRSEPSNPWGKLYETALGQIDEIRDAIVRGSQAGKAKLDSQLLKRQRDRVLSEIGALVVEEHKRGGPAPTGTAELMARAEALAAQIAEAEREADRVFARAADKAGP